jgi:predicted alpha/beta-hydrolase family hydrolase
MAEARVPVKKPVTIRVSLDAGASVKALVYSPEANGVEMALILAPGAGAGQRSPFMKGFAEGLAALRIDVVTFDFPYAEAGRRVPDRRPVLEACYRAAIDAVRREISSARTSLFIGGKSMGGRMATHVAASDRELPVDGLVLLGYPLHPPGRPEDRRDSHLPDVGRPMLFVQGSQDGFGTPIELAPVVAALRPASSLHVVHGADHSLRVRKRAAAAQAEVFREVQSVIADWIRGVRRDRAKTGS